MPTTRAAWITTGAICGYRVTEYLPHSYSIIYKIDPLTMTATEVFDYDDSIGAIVCNTDDRTLVGMNWDARDFYHWTLDGQGSVTNADVAPKELAVENPSFYVAFQDGQYLGDYLMLGSGLQGFRTPAGDLRLGGWKYSICGTTVPCAKSRSGYGYRREAS